MLKVYILFFLLIVTTSFSQVVFSPLISDPQRKDLKSGIPTARIAEVAPDTISLPFFEDFTAANASIENVLFYTDSIRITTLGNHGLKNGDQIYLSFQEEQAAYLNNNYFVKVDSKKSFLLYTDFALQYPMIPVTIPEQTLNRYWRRPGSTVGPNPDTLKWMSGGGTFINNKLHQNPPSIYAASFDGLDSNGKPYVYNRDVNGPTDHLTSVPINLSGLDASSNVVLSFYWQAGGNGFFPDNKDSLYLAFKDVDSTWQWQWSKRGGGFTIDSSKFYYEEIVIDDPSFLYNGFQFRFQSVGSRGGSHENWNIDYIYFDKNWDDNKKNTRDRAISKSQTSILKNFTSIPVDHFLINPQTYLNDQVSFEMKSLSSSLTLIEFNNNFIKSGNAVTPFSVMNPDEQFRPFDTISYTWDPGNYELPPFAEYPYKLTYNINALTADPNQFNGIDFTTNNADSSETILDDYYSYDDGTAEVQGGQPSGGTMIFSYALLNPGDTLTDVEIYLPENYRSKDDVKSQITFIFLDKDKATPLGRGSKTFDVDYSVGLNEFKRYSIRDSVSAGIIIPSDTFYIGFMTPRAIVGIYQYFPIGVDMNNNYRNKVYHKEYASEKYWQELITPGTFMIRPVFQNVPITGVFDKNVSTLKCAVYPNPTTGITTIEGEVDEIILYDFSGKILLKTKQSSYLTLSTHDFSFLQSGLYTLHLTNNKGLQAIKKLSILK